MFRVAYILLTVGALALAACGGGGAGSTDLAGDDIPLLPTGGTLRVHVTDAPFPFDSVLEASVVIDEVRVRRKGEAEGWVTVFERDETDDASGRINLVEYQNGITFLLVEAALEPGTYDEVRLLVSAGRVLLDDSEEGGAVIADGNPEFTTENGKLDFPSGAQSGIKVKLDNEIVVTTELSGDLLLDFGLTKNFVFNGPITHQPGVKRVLFTPVVRATNKSEAGSLEIEVLSDTDWDGDGDEPIAGATVTVFLAEGESAIPPGGTDDSGFATFSVAPGSYHAKAEVDGHAPGETTEATEVFLANLSRTQIVLAVTGEIQGNVMSTSGTDDTTDDDWSIAGVTVEARALATDVDPVSTATTDANGSFQLTGLTPGSYHLTFQADGFDDGSADSVAAAASAITGATYMLTPKTQTVGFTVTDATIPASITVTVAATGAGTSEDVVVSPNATDGTFTLVLESDGYSFTFDDGDDTTTNPTATVDVTGGEPQQDGGSISFST